MTNFSVAICRAQKGFSKKCPVRDLGTVLMSDSEMGCESEDESDIAETEES